LTEALAKLNQVPLAFFRRDENPNKDFFYILIRINGTYFILLQFIVFTIPEIKKND
jgi:hypothetical protein